MNKDNANEASPQTAEACLNFGNKKGSGGEPGGAKRIVPSKTRQHHPREHVREDHCHQPVIGAREQPLQRLPPRAACLMDSGEFLVHETSLSSTLTSRRSTRELESNRAVGQVEQPGSDCLCSTVGPQIESNSHGRQLITYPLPKP